MTDEQLGLLYMGIMGLTIILIVRWFIRSAKKSYRDNWYKKMVGSRSVNGLLFLVMRLCIEPMSKTIKGKDFFSIDWNAVKEEHKLTPTKKFKDKTTQELLKKLSEADIKFSPEAVDTINAIFFAEVDDVVADIDRQIEYVQETWILEPTGKRMMEGLFNEFNKLWSKKALPMPLGDLHMFGYKIIQLIDKILREEKINAAFRGELEVEEDEPVYYEEEYDDYDDGGYYTAPVVNEIHHHHETTIERPIEHKPFPERKPAPQPKPIERPKQKWYKVQRMDRGGGWSDKYSSNNLRNAEQQMRRLQEGAYRLQDQNQPSVRWRIVDEDNHMVM